MVVLAPRFGCTRGPRGCPRPLFGRVFCPCPLRAAPEPENTQNPTKTPQKLRKNPQNHAKSCKIAKSLQKVRLVSPRFGSAAPFVRTACHNPARQPRARYGWRRVPTEAPRPAPPHSPAKTLQKLCKNSAKSRKIMQNCKNIAEIPFGESAVQFCCADRAHRVP